MNRWPIPNTRIGVSFDPSLDYSPRLKYYVKSLIYSIYCPAYTTVYGRHLGFKDLLLNDITIGGRGSEFDLLLFQQSCKNRIKDEVILLQGVGDGRELVMWQHYNPAKVVGVDLRIHLDDDMPNYRFEHKFIAADMSRIPLEAGIFDGVASTNVYEHIQDLESVITETRRLLKPGGWFMAAFGPLYHSLVMSSFEV
jgi:SAM-dependent methyltransferase